MASKKEKARRCPTLPSRLSGTAQVVPSAQKGLTDLFEMGTGVAPSPLPSGKGNLLNPAEKDIIHLRKNSIPEQKNNEYVPISH